MKPNLDRLLLMVVSTVFSLSAFSQESIIWTVEQSPIQLKGNFVVPATGSLTIQPGVQVLVPPAAGIIVNGALLVDGTDLEPIVFRCTDPNRSWGGIAVDGAKGTVLIRHASISRTEPLRYRVRTYPGAVTVNNSTATIEHCSFSAIPGICIDADRSRMVIRYNDFDTIGEGVHCNASYSLVEGNTFLHLAGYNDAIDFDLQMGNEISIIRGNFIGSSEDDGIDLGFTTTRIEGNYIQNCADKGISMEGPSQPVVLNNIIRTCNIGMAVKDRCDARIAHNTVLESTFGISLYEKNAGANGASAQIVNTVVWYTKVSVELDAKSTVQLVNCNLMQWEPAFGESSFSRNPQFTTYENAGYYPAPGSPLIDTGAVYDLTIDYRGQPRPLGKAPDIGAYETDYPTAIKGWMLPEMLDR